MITEEEFYKACAILVEFIAQSMKTHFSPPNSNELVLADGILGVRTLSCLRSIIDKPTSEITLGDICKFSVNDLYRLRNFGSKTMSEIELVLKANGLKLKS